MNGPGAGDLFPLDRALRGIRERFAEALIDAERTSLRERTVVVPAERLAEVAGALVNEWGATLLTLFGLDERAEHGRFRLHAMFSMEPEDAMVTLVAAVPGLGARYVIEARVQCYAGATHRVSLVMRYADDNTFARFWLHEEVRS